MGNKIDCDKKIKKAVEKNKKQTIKKCDEGDKIKQGCAERVQKAYHAGQGGNTEKNDKVRKMREKWLKERRKRRHITFNCNIRKTRQKESGWKNRCKETEQKAFRKGHERGSKKVQARRERFSKSALNGIGAVSRIPDFGTTRNKRNPVSRTVTTLEAAQE